jgi:nucleotide-binding universal stress UspA family protein
MLNSIVVPLDQSELSESALPIADELAAALDSSIVLLTAGWGSTVEDLDVYLRSQAKKLTVPVTTTVVPDTFPATAITGAVTGSDDAVVMATHGRTGMGKALLGSVAEDVLKRSGHPVLLLGPSVKDFRSCTGGTMAVTTDGSPISALILPCAARWAKALSMSVHVISVTTAGGVPLGGAEPEALASATSGAVAFFKEHGIDAVAETLVGADAADAIADWTNENPISMVAMATHGRGGLARTALGSTTIKVVHKVHSPVLVQKPAG